VATRNSPDQDRDPLVVRVLIYAATLLATLVIIPLLIAVAVQSGLLDGPLAALRAVALFPIALLVMGVGASVGLALFLAPGWLDARRAGLVLGATDSRWTPWWRATDDERAAHALILGVSGMGKSRLLLAIVLQCLDRRREAVAVLDTHGTLVRDIVGLTADTIDERGGLILQGAHPDHVYGFDPLRCRPGESPTSRALALALALGAIAGESWSARIELYLTAVCGALIEADYTLAEGPRFLTDDAFRAYALGRCTSEAAREFAADLAQKHDRQFADEVASVLVKLRRIVSHPEARALLGLEVTDPAYVRHRRASLPGYEPHVVDPMALLAAGCPVLIALPQRDLGPYNVTIAALICATLLDAAMSRDALAAGGPIERVTLVADELQSYATSTVVDLVEQARKFGLSLFASCTMLHTVPPAIRTALLGVRLLAAFQLTTEDAPLLAQQLYRRVLERTGQRGARRDTSMSPGDIEDYQADQLRVTPPRWFRVHSRVRGGDATLVRTPDIETEDDPAVDKAAREASGRCHGNRRADVEAEFALRRAWLDGRGYLARRPMPPGGGQPAVSPTIDADTTAPVPDADADLDNPFA